jgi:hypothetical protein
MIEVLVTVGSDDGQLARLRTVSPRLSVRRLHLAGIDALVDHPACAGVCGGTWTEPRS